jgi:hypothetical protein
VPPCHDSMPASQNLDPLSIPDFPANPHCGGRQWSVLDEDALANLTALVLIGRAKHAESILAGAQRNFVVLPDALKEQIRAQLHPPEGPLTYHRDGLLFEIISWIVARLASSADDIISTPHLKSTQQGLDTIKISFDPHSRVLIRAVIYEQKCSENARDKFRDEVIPAFHEWRSHKRDNQLVQAVTSLVERFDLTDSEHMALYDQIVQVHPIAFQAALTVTPSPFNAARCVALFNGYSAVTVNIDDRMGDTFPLSDIRAWFSHFATLVWQKVEAENV